MNVKDELRLDGRCFNHYRPIEVVFNTINNSYGSCELILVFYSFFLLLLLFNLKTSNLNQGRYKSNSYNKSRNRFTRRLLAEHGQIGLFCRLVTFFWTIRWNSNRLFSNLSIFQSQVQQMLLQNFKEEAVNESHHRLSMF